MSGSLGILAGRGELPWIVAENAIQAGEDVHIFPYTDEAIPSALKPYCTPVVLTRMYASVFASLKKKGVKRLISIGKASKDILYKNLIHCGAACNMALLGKQFSPEGSHLKLILSRQPLLFLYNFQT